MLGGVVFGWEKALSSDRALPVTDQGGGVVGEVDCGGGREVRGWGEWGSGELGVVVGILRFLSPAYFLFSLCFWKANSVDQLLYTCQSINMPSFA